jgi:hypothetical protein
MARTIATGADWCNAARGFMFAVGCIQSQSCHTDHCPTGVATQDARRQKAINVASKAERVHKFHHSTLEALGDLVGAAGLGHPNELRPHHIMKRIAPTTVQSFEEIYHFLEPDELLNGSRDEHYAHEWAMADPDSWAPIDPQRHIIRSHSYHEIPA